MLLQVINQKSRYYNFICYAVKLNIINFKSGHYRLKVSKKILLKRVCPYNYSYIFGNSILSQNIY